MSKKFNHIIVLLALLSAVITSCQKEVSGDSGGTAETGRLSKAYYWYDGDTTAIPSFMDTVYYNSLNLISKVIRTDHLGQDPETFTFEYNANKKVTKIMDRNNGVEWDYVFHYSSTGVLDSMSTFSMSGSVVSYLERVISFQYAGEDASRVYSYAYNGGIRKYDDSIRYYRTGSEFDSFAVYHVGSTMGPPDLAVAKYSGPSPVEMSSFANIISSGYLILLSYNPNLGITYDRFIHQFANPRNLLLRNMSLRVVWSGSSDEEPVNFHYAFYPSGLVRAFVMEDIINGSSVPEAFKFEYVK